MTACGRFHRQDIFTTLEMQLKYNAKILQPSDTTSAVDVNSINSSGTSPAEFRRTQIIVGIISKHCAEKVSGFKTESSPLRLRRQTGVCMLSACLLVAKVMVAEAVLSCQFSLQSHVWSVSANRARNSLQHFAEFYDDPQSHDPLESKEKKSFPSHKAHRAALISVSLALSQTPAYTARPRIRG